MEKSLLMLYRGNDMHRDIPFKNKKHRESYEHLYGMCHEKGIATYRASCELYDPEKKVFSQGWQFAGGEWKKVTDISPSLVCDKSKGTPKANYYKGLIAQDYRITNELDFTLLAGNKFFSSLLLPKHFKKYHKARNKSEIKKVALDIPGEKVVIKPAIGAEGKDVIIIDKSEIDSVDVKAPVIVQEFVDSSKGIPGVMTGLHDLRIIFIDEEPIYSFMRQPAPGSLLANVALGGSTTFVDLEDLPESLNPIIKDVHKVFEFFKPKIYCVDFIFDENGKPWIIELNTMPAMYFSPKNKERMSYRYKLTIDLFVKMLNEE